MSEALEQLIGVDEMEAAFNRLPFSLRQDRLAALMSEPAAPIKAGTGVRGHSPSGPVNTGELGKDNS